MVVALEPWNATLPTGHWLFENPSESTALKASLIICTRNRASRLSVCLGYLDSVDFTDAELVLVDNGSDDDTARILASWAAGKGHVRIVHEPTKGLGNARNAGWKASRGSILVFTDDDCYAAPTYVQEHTHLYEMDARLGWVSGRILLYDPLDAKITIQENTFTVPYAPYRFLEPGAVHGANLSFRRAALDAIGGFDSLMGVGSYFPCEDLDAAARVAFQGFAGLYSPNPVVQHHHGRQTNEEVRALEQTYRLGRGAYYGKCLSTRGMRSIYLRRILGKWFHQPAPEIWLEAKSMCRWWWIAHRLARRS